MRRRTRIHLQVVRLSIFHLAFAGALLGQAAEPAAPRSGWSTVGVDAAGPQDPWLKVPGDLDGDGLCDIIVGGRSGLLVWYRSPVWSKHRIAGGGWSTVGGSAADTDGDGDLDVVLGGTVWFENPGDLKSAPEAAWKLHRIGDDPTHDALVGDLDGDRRLDVVTRSQSEFGAKAGNKVRVWLQRPGDVWRGEVLDCAHGEGLAVGDLDKDGDPDIVLGGAWLETIREGGAVRWQSHRLADFHPNVTIALADLNGDGRLDVVLAPSELAGQKHRMAWFEAPENPRADPWREHVIAREIEAVVHSLATADIDLDGRSDIVFAEMHQGADPDEVAVLLSGGGGASWRKQVLSESGSHGVQLLDFDGDGDMDAFGANWSGPLQPIELWVNPARSRAAAPSRKPGEETSLALADGIKLGFAWVPSGRFIMGAPPGDPHRGVDEAPHEVTLTHGFWLGKFEITNREYREFRPGHRSWGIGGEKGEFDGDDQPVVCVDLADAQAFCRWASEKTGRSIRLATEAEWEYACRAGSTSKYCFGDDEKQLGDHCWYSGNSGWVSHPVGLKKPNAWGLHDMHGNVAEWVSDWYGYYSGGPQTDPKGPPAGGQHCWRECSWSSRAFEARCSQRDRAVPTYKSAALGLRVACEP